MADMVLAHCVVDAPLPGLDSGEVFAGNVVLPHAVASSVSIS